MIIVYQSLESTGKKEDSFGTALMGNSFKHQTQANAGAVFSLGTDRKRDYKRPVYQRDLKKITYPTSTIQFATQQESKNLSSAYLGLLGPEGQPTTQSKAELRAFLEGVIDTIKKSTMNRTQSRGDLPSARVPDLIVLGEAFTTDIEEDLGVKSVGGYEIVTGMNPTGDSRHRFVVLRNEHSRTSLGDVEFFPYLLTSDDNKDENARCVILKVMGWVMAFVHTPNSICNDGLRVLRYLKNNAREATETEELDLVMGDTNQKKSDFVSATLKNHLGGGDWVTSVLDEKQELVGFGGHDTFSISGTNSNYTTHFDIACSRQVTAVIKDGKAHAFDEGDPNVEPVFVFHGLTDKHTELKGKAYAYSDHNGVIVEVLRWRKRELALREKKRRAEIVAAHCPDCRQVLTALDKIARKHVTCPRQPLSIRWNPIGGGAEDEAPTQPLKKRRSDPSSGTL
ncbi:hypothetical protein KRR26_22185 [Corallococcus sp. M34]|uniref:hypothetical protein n=1 Tax=Citreicoccus inhibens TaxID=2849499 RepID=UPI001C2300FE|nr:hypothetical protein [Citreicoccus inhibens]MBU8898324.1 hypothetical protein [Citreicoccus inhibens]